MDSGICGRHGRTSLQLAARQIQEAAINQFYGSALGMFQIKSPAPGNRSRTYNFLVIRQSDQQIVNRRPDAEMLLGFINRQRAR